MRRVAQDDTQAFDTLLLRHQAAVFNFLRRTVPDTDLAEDLTQECFLRVWRARGGYLPAAMFRTWIFTIARRLALDAAKRRRIETVSLIDEHDHADCRAQFADNVESGVPVDPEQILLAQELRDVLDCALQELPADLQEVVILRDLEHLDYAHIAAIVGCPLGTVKSRLNAARSRLRAVARRWYQE